MLERAETRSNRGMRFEWRGNVEAEDLRWSAGRYIGMRKYTLGCGEIQWDERETRVNVRESGSKGRDKFNGDEILELRCAENEEIR